MTASIRLDGGDFVVIRIRDFGPGIPDDELPLVKKKFLQGQLQGQRLRHRPGGLR